MRQVVLLALMKVATMLLKIKRLKKCLKKCSFCKQTFQNDVTHLDGTLKLSLFAFRLPGSGLKSQLPLQYAKLAYEMCKPVT